MQLFFTWSMFYSVSFFHDTCDFPEIFACPDFCFSSWHSVSEHAWEHEIMRLWRIHDMRNISVCSERRGTMHVLHGSNSCTHATMHHAGFKIPWVWVAPTSLPNPSRSQWYPKTHPSQQHCQGGPWSRLKNKKIKEAWVNRLDLEDPGHEADNRQDVQGCQAAGTVHEEESALVIPHGIHEHQWHLQHGQHAGGYFFIRSSAVQATSIKRST